MGKCDQLYANISWSSFPEKIKLFIFCDPYDYWDNIRFAYWAS